MKRLSNNEIMEAVAVTRKSGEKPPPLGVGWLTEDQAVSDALKAHQQALKPVRKPASDCHSDWLQDTRPRWNNKVVEPVSPQ